MSGDTRHLDKAALDILFTEARTQNAWLDKPVDDALLQEIWALTRMGPTSANAMPARVVFVKSAAAKELLRPALSAGNLEKTMSAPVVAIIAHDLKFYDQLPKLFPHADARAWFTGNAALSEATAFRNGTLQGAYLMMAARALGLDCGPMSGFDAAKVDAAFFPDGQVKTNFLCNLGYGSGEKLFPRSPRLTFDEACKIA